MSFCTQFYADPIELLNFIVAAKSEFGLEAVMLKFRPSFSLIHLEGMKVEDILLFMEKHAIRTIALSMKKFDETGDNQGKFCDLNPEHFIFDVARIRDGKLEESWNSTMLNDGELYKVAKKINTKLKKMSKAGVTVIRETEPKSKSFQRTFRYTEGAKKLEDSGVTMVTITNIPVKLGKIE